MLSWFLSTPLSLFCCFLPNSSPIFLPFSPFLSFFFLFPLPFYTVRPSTPVIITPSVPSSPLPPFLFVPRSPPPFQYVTVSMPFYLLRSFIVSTCSPCHVASYWTPVLSLYSLFGTFSFFPPSPLLLSFPTLPRCIWPLFRRLFFVCSVLSLFFPYKLPLSRTPLYSLCFIYRHEPLSPPKE